MNKVYLTREKHEELLRELDDLKTSKRQTIAERLEFAKSLGDLAENYEYHSTREEQVELEERISQLEGILKVSEIVSSFHQTATVEVGSTLKVKKETGGLTQQFTLVGAEEADLGTGKISYESPLGAALLGKKKGEDVTVSTPKGEVKYKILEIE